MKKYRQYKFSQIKADKNMDREKDTEESTEVNSQTQKTYGNLPMNVKELFCLFVCSAKHLKMILNMLVENVLYESQKVPQ